VVLPLKIGNLKVEEEKKKLEKMNRNLNQAFQMTLVSTVKKLELS